jgi:2-desacetyl-2-hydroxyethyl bacteriochlorophyllide A dehydrogenase
MRTLVLEAPGRLALADSGAPGRPGVGGALVRVRRVGVCGTDYHAFRGRQPFFSYPRTLGHELGVEVVEVGPGVEIQVGERCAVEPYLNCESCIACRRGKPNCCVSLQVLGVHADGGMTEFLIVPARKLHPSRALSFDQLALVETLGIGAHAVARGAAERGEWALVIGAGPIGLGVMQFALQAGAHVVAMDLDDSRLQFCRDQLGVSHTVRAGEGALEQVRELTNGDLPTLVFDATGHPASMKAAFDLVAPGGRLVFVGLFPGEVSFHDPDFHRKEMTLFASRNATPQDFGRIIALLESGEIDTRPWMTHRAALEDVPREFERWLDPQSRVIKAMIEV